MPDHALSFAVQEALGRHQTGTKQFSRQLRMMRARVIDEIASLNKQLVDIDAYLGARLEDLPTLIAQRVAATQPVVPEGRRADPPNLRPFTPSDRNAVQRLLLKNE